jgi:hypothetical protein
MVIVAIRGGQSADAMFVDASIPVSSVCRIQFVANATRTLLDVILGDDL